ncbi:MAG: hypothetical protein V3V20_05400 [Algisphaera sp.]
MLFQTIRKNDDPRYVPLVLVHDRDSDGNVMMERLRSLAWQYLDFNALLVCPSFTGHYGFLQSKDFGANSDQLLLDALAQQTDVPQITDRFLVYGFGDGAQFAHRFAMKHPRRVAGCAALSGASWTDPSGLCTGQMVVDGAFDTPPYNTPSVHTARDTKCSSPASLPGVVWMIGCANDDTDESTRSATQLQVDLAQAGCRVDYLDWDGAPNQASPHLTMNVMHFFNEVVATPAELPELPPEPQVTASDAPQATSEEVDDAVEQEAKQEVEAEPPTKPAPKPGQGNGFFDQLLRTQNTTSNPDAP